MSKPSFGRRLFLLIRRHPLRLIIFMMSLIGSILGVIIFLLVMPDLKCLKIERAGQDYERQLLQLVVDGLSESVIKDANPEDIGFLTDHDVDYYYRLRNIGKRSRISPNAWIRFEHDDEMMSRRGQFILYAKQRQRELFTDTRREGEQYFYFYDLIKGNDDGSAVEIVQITLTQIDSENKSGIDIGVVYSNKIYDQNAITPEDIYREFMENN